MAAQLRPKLVIDRMRTQGFTFGQLERRFFGGSEIVANAKVGQVLDLILRPAMPLCQSGV